MSVYTVIAVYAIAPNVVVFGAFFVLNQVLGGGIAFVGHIKPISLMNL
jgi:hypothetical protein